MIPRINKYSWVFVITVAAVATSSSILGDQPDSDEMVFETPLVSPTAPARRSIDPPPQQKTMNKNAPAGKANISRSNVALPPKQARPNPSTAGTNRTSSSKISNSAVKSPATSIVQASSTGNDPAVTTASHADPMQGVTPDGEDPILKSQRKKRSPTQIPLVTAPSNRGAAPGVRGALLGLNGESATERALKMMEANAELERENDELRQQNAALIARVKESHHQLTAGVREIQLARKELTSARGDLDRLRSEMQGLRDKVRVAEREYSALLQSMGPLLQQLVESDDVSALPPSPVE